MKTASRQTQPNDEAPPAPSYEVNLRNHHGSLRSKLVLSLGAMFFVFLTIDEVVRQRVIEPEFASLERAGAIRDANRVLAAMNAEVEHLGDLANHWAGQLGQLSSESHAEPESQQRKRNWTPQNLEWAVVVSDDGTWRWLESPNVPDLPAKHHQDFIDLALWLNETEDTSCCGMTRVMDDSLVMFASIELTPDASEQPSGSDQTAKAHLIVGRKFDQAMIASIRKQTQVDFSLQAPQWLESKSASNSTISVWEADDSLLIVEFQLLGIDQKPLANVCVQVPRDITAHSSQTTAMARNSFIFGSVAALLMLLLLLQRIVIGPLTAIREHSEHVAERGFDAEPLVLPGNDEIGELANAFDNMMHRLGDAQQQLAAASQAAGRSQVASTVIHNVGNVLTNVNSLLDVASERVQGLRIDPLSRLAGKLRDSDDAGALIQATPDYLEGLAESLDADRDTISELITTLHDNVRHIHDVIRDQQRHTGHQLHTTSVCLRDVIDEAIGCCRAKLEQDSVSVKFTGALESDVCSDRSLLLQSVINVIGNARHALRGQKEAARTLEISALLKGKVLEVRFQDNGVGMSEETRQQIFDAHFTTRKTGSGLGLHFCANTLKKLGGAISAQSDGLGTGSTIVMELPLAAKSAASLSNLEEAPVELGASI
ncbi:MAG: ATP-binding protein [Pirellulales bacterium]|nr:ATP-binding protein [Pirellulales bacterium]